VEDKPIFSICLNAFPGTNRALVNLSQTSKLTRHVSVASTQPEGPEARFLIMLLQEHLPDIVLFGGWSPVYAHIMHELRNTGIRFGVYWTSSGGQTDMSEEMPKLAHILRDPGIDHLVFSSPGLAEGLQAAGRQVWNLPVTLTIPESLPDAPSGSRREDRALAISLFCPPAEYRRKNILNCLLALSETVGQFKLYVNGLSEYPAYRTMLDELQVVYQDLGWMERATYEDFLWSLDLGLQVSFAESYDYVAAEHIARGVPVVASPMVPVIEMLSPNTRSQLVVNAADTVDAIRERVQMFVDDPARCKALGNTARDEFLRANVRNVEIATEVMQAIVELTT